MGYHGRNVEDAFCKTRVATRLEQKIDEVEKEVIRDQEVLGPDTEGLIGAKDATEVQ